MRLPFFISASFLALAPLWATTNSAVASNVSGPEIESLLQQLQAAATQEDSMKVLRLPRRSPGAKDVVYSGYALVRATVARIGPITVQEYPEFFNAEGEQDALSRHESAVTLIVNEVLCGDVSEPQIEVIARIATRDARWTQGEYDTPIIQQGDEVLGFLIAHATSRDGYNVLHGPSVLPTASRHGLPLLDGLALGRIISLYEDAASRLGRECGHDEP
jgi:hypothetical protein